MARRAGRSARVVAALIACATASGAGQQSASTRSGHAGQPQGDGRRPSAVTAPAAFVVGWVWSAERFPIPDAAVRLRSVLSGQVEGNARTDQGGSFVFRDVPAGTYLVELVDERGRVRAASDVFGVDSGETVTTYVRLPSYGHALARLFDNTGAAIVAAAASLGITAFAPTRGPASPER